MNELTAFALLLLGVAVHGQTVAVPSIPSCLPLKTTVVAISARARGSHYCSNSTRDVHLRARLLSEVEQGPVDKRCRLYAPRFLECTTMGNTQGNMRTRMMIAATMTCDSPCVRHSTTLQSLGTLKDNLIYLRTATQQRQSVDLSIEGVDVLMWFFDGRESIVSTCQSNSTSAATKGLRLCDCALQCDKCGDGYYLPPMASRCQPCPQGTWRKAGLDYSSCVQCPSATNTSSFGASAPTDCIAPVCPEGKLFSECGPVCRPTCTNPTPPDGCPSDCVSGCFCPMTTVEQNGECVMPSDCADLGPPPPRPPVIVATNITSGEVNVTIGYDIRVYEGVNISVDCSPLVQEHPEGSIHWHAQPINPRAIVRNSAPDFPVPISPVELVVPSTSIPNFLQMSFRCDVCVSSQCWSNNSIISVVTIPPPPPPSLPPPILPPPSCPPGRIFKECGRACPPSCKELATGCPDLCVAGCFCPDGQYDDNGKCVHRESCSHSNTLLKSTQPQFCQLSQDPGPCSDATDMFSYNPLTGGCNRFTYGGCLGNDNRFSTEKACLDMCSA